MTIVGDKPNFLNDKVRHIPQDDFPNHRESSIVNKMLRYCEETDTETFYRWDDDIYMMKPLKPEDIKHWYSDKLSNWIANPRTRGTYRDVVERTKERFGDSNYYDLHYPMLYDKKKFLDSMLFIRREKPELLTKTTYCILNNIIGEEGEKDLKINRPVTQFEIGRLVHNRTFFSTGDHAWPCYNMERFLGQMFNKKSRWER